MTAAEKILVDAAVERLEDSGYFRKRNLQSVLNSLVEKDDVCAAKDKVAEYFAHQPEYKLRLFLDIMTEIDNVVRS